MDYMKNGGDPRIVLIAAVVILFNALPFIAFLIFATISSAVILGAAFLALCNALLLCVESGFFVIVFLTLKQLMS